MKLFSLRAFVLALLCSISLSSLAGVDINSASAEQLAKNLNGVGPAKAAAIVAYRDTHGPFESVDQLAKVKGIGSGTVEKNRQVIELGTSDAADKKE
ncbi:MAG: helix-hairpin-helix domain-containing protein [Neptuniibacter sp.]